MAQGILINAWSFQKLDKILILGHHNRIGLTSFVENIGVFCMTKIHITYMDYINAKRVMNPRNEFR